MAQHPDERRPQGMSQRQLTGTWRCPSCGLDWDNSVLVCPRDGERLENPVQNDPAFNLYEVIGLIGSGGMGVIYKARQPVLNKLVAIKMLHPYLLSAEAIRRFQTEGQAANKLEHPFIIKIHNLGLAASGPYMIMDYIDGQTLSDVLQSQGPLSVERFLRVFIQTADALAHAHSRGVLHRDLKPSNIMLRKNFRDEEEVCVMDFGIAKLIDDAHSTAAGSRLTRTGEAIGSPLYMSPEQALGASVDQRSDLYSLGCVMYETLTGSPPFNGNTPLETMMMHRAEIPVSMSQALLGARSFDSDLEAVVERLLQKDPDRRYQSMDELKAHLSAIRDGSGLGRFIYKAPPIKGVGTAKKVLIGASTLAVLAAGCIAGYLTINDNKKPQPERIQSSTFHVDPLDNTIVLEEFVRNKNETIRVSAPLSNWLTDDDLAVLEQATSAKCIKIKRAYDVTSEGLKHLTKLPQLSALDVSWCPHIVDFSVFQGMQNLRSLELVGDPIGDKELERLRGMRLENLDLGSTKVHDLNALKDMHSLQKLDLSRTQVSAEGIRNICQLKNLESVELDETPVRSSDLQYFTQLPKLSRLYLNGCPNLSETAVKEIKSKLPHDCDVQDQGIGSSLKTISTNENVNQAGEDAQKMLDKGTRLFQNDRFIEASDLLTRTLAALKQQSPLPKDDILHCRYYLGQCKLRSAKSQDLELAFKLFSENIADVEKLGPASKLALPHLYYLKGTALGRLAKVADALTAYNTSNDLYSRLRPQVLGESKLREWDIEMAETLRTLGLTHSALHSHADCELAKNELKSAADKFDRSGAGAYAGLCYKPLGDLYFDDAQATKDTQKALELYAEALRIYYLADKYSKLSIESGFEPPSAEPEAKTMIAVVEAQLGHHEKAHAMLIKLLAIPISKNFRQVQLNTMILTCNRTARPAEAQKYKEELKRCQR